MASARGNGTVSGSDRQRAERTVMPPADLEELLDLGKFLPGVSENAALLGPDGKMVPLPEEVFHVLRAVVDAMNTGKAVTVAPVDQLLTTQETANILGISRPTMVKLLEQGHIPYERTTGGRHRRIRLSDALGYQERKRSERRVALQELTAEASEYGLYDVDAQAYADALEQARREG